MFTQQTIRWSIRTLTGLLVPILFLGCTMAGTWKSASLEPEMARDEFRLFNHVPPGMEFTKALITLHDDKTYNAEVYYGNHVIHSAGQWEKTDDMVTFVDQEGGSYTYQSDLSSDKNHLTLIQTLEGTDVKLKLKRKSF